MEGELNRAICEALIGLGAKTVVVLSEDFEKGGFAWVEIADDQLTIAFYDEDAVKQYEQTVSR